MAELCFLPPRDRVEGVCPGWSDFTFERFCHPVCPSALRRQSTGKRYFRKMLEFSCLLAGPESSAHCEDGLQNQDV